LYFTKLLHEIENFALCDPSALRRSGVNPLKDSAFFNKKRNDYLLAKNKGFIGSATGVNPIKVILTSKKSF